MSEYVGRGCALLRARDEPLAQVDGRAHVGRHRDLEGRGLPRLGHAARDRLPHARERDALRLRESGGRGSGRSGRGGGRRALDVLGDDAALRAGAAQPGEVDAALARDSPRERRGLHAPAVLSLLRDLRSRSRCLGLPSSLALFLAPRSGLSLLHFLFFGDLDLGLLLLGLRLFFLGLGLLLLGNVLAFLADDGDRLADLDLVAFAGQDPEQDSRSVGLHLLRDLLGVELVERLPLLDLVALGLEPLDDRPGLHALPEARERDLVGH